MTVRYVSAIGIRMLTILFTVFFLFGCGSVGANPSTTSTQTSSITPSPVVGKVIEISKLLQVHYTRGIDCPLGYIDALSPYLPGALELSSTQSTYDEGAILQMKDFLQHAFPSYSETGIFSLQVPDGLLLTPGSPTGNTSDWAMYGNGSKQGCSATIEITNITSSDIELAGISAQITTAPHQNYHTYQLINVCSFSILPTYDCPPSGRAGGGGDDYDLHLSMADANTIFDGQRNMDPQGPGGTIHPGDVRTADITFTSSTTSKGPDNLVYDVIPILKINVSGEQRTIPLPQLSSTLVFVHADQTSCYSLAKDRFVQIHPTAKLDQHVWCV